MMTRIAVTALVGMAAMSSAFADEAEKAIRVLIVTGGHDFDRAEFFEMFDSLKGIEWSEAQHPAANDMYTQEASKAYDVVVLYDMVQEITEAQKENFIRLFREDGKGLVGLHHCLSGYQSWPEYTKIIGGKYVLADVVENGKVVRPMSTYDHDQDLHVQILDPADPITKGVKDFDTHDESYKGFDVLEGVKPLLRVDHPKCGPIIGWSHEYGKARVAYILLGHDKKGYASNEFKQIVRNAIVWAARKDGDTNP